jgi:glycosyltransferase involved in cell wall biosynthesis
MALAVGFQQARGEKVVTMDADLQDDPAEIPRLLEKIDEGWDLVSGWKKVRKDPFEKRLMSKMFNAVVSATSGLKLHDFNCGLKAYRIEVVKTVKVYGELHRFLPLIAFYYGFRVAEVPVAHHPRQFGKSKYGKGRYFAGLFDFVSVNFLMSYQRKPLHLLGKISFFSFFIGTLLVGYVCFMKFIMGGTGNRPTLTAGVFFYGLAVQIFIFGLLAELVTFTGHSNNVRYQDFIKETIPSRQG